MRARRSPRPRSPSRPRAQASGEGLTVNQIYEKDSPGVVFIRAESAAQAAVAA